MPVAVRLREGKGAYVRRKLPNGEIIDICDCIWNADFSIRGCAAQVHGAYMAEVVRNNGKYDKGSLPAKRREHGVDHTCDYCYAYQNWGQITPRAINESTEREFQKKQPKIIRLGKDTECGHDIYVPALMSFLDLCLKYNTRIIFPTKMLRFRKDVAEKLRQVGGAVHRSIGADRFEKGVVSQGYSNAWRVEQARLDFQAEINEDLTIVCDVTQSLQANQRAGFYVVRALLDAEKFGLVARIIPLRINSEKLARAVTGHSFRELRNIQPSLPGYEMPLQGLWRKRGNNELAPNFLHSDFESLYRAGIGICGEVGDMEYCDKCNLCPSSPERIVFPLSEKPRVEYTMKVDAKGRRDWKNKEKRIAEKEQDRMQLKLF